MTGLPSPPRSYSTFAPTTIIKENRHKAIEPHTSVPQAQARPSATEAQVAQPADALTKGEQVVTITLTFLALIGTITLIILWLVLVNIITKKPRTFCTDYPRLVRLGSYREMTFPIWMTMTLTWVLCLCPWVPSVRARSAGASLACTACHAVLGAVVSGVVVALSPPAWSCPGNDRFTALPDSRLCHGELVNPLATWNLWRTVFSRAILWSCSPFVLRSGS